MSRFGGPDPQAASRGLATRSASDDALFDGVERLSALEHSNFSPFSEWLDHAPIRDLVHAALALPAGERLILVKGLVPRMGDAFGKAGLAQFCHELALKRRRFEEAQSHPGQGRLMRETSGELIG